MSKTYLRCCEETVEGLYTVCPKCGADLLALIGIKTAQPTNSIDRYSQLDGYIRAYTFFRDILTDSRYNPRALSVEDSEQWLAVIEENLTQFEMEINEL